MTEWIGAFSAGIFVMASPCILPLYPGFLAYLSGQGSGERRTNTLLLGFLVLLGVVTMMVTLGALIAALSISVGKALLWLTPVAYVVVIVLGLLLILDRNPFLRMSQVRAPVLANPYANAFVYGLLYGPIALPCSGPLLSGIFIFSVTTAELFRQIALFFVFGLGFGVPLFLLALLEYSLQQRVVRFFLDHRRTINVVAGVLLVLVGAWSLAREWDSILFSWQYRNL